GLLPLMLDVIQNPAFPQEKLDLAKTQALSGLARRNDDPGDIASREFDRALFSDDLPFGWTQERDTIKPLTREHLIARHKDIFFANRAVAGIVGDFDAAAMKKTLEAVFNKLPSAEEKLADLPKVAGEAKPRVVLINRPEINQTNIFMGHVGVQRTPDDPDYFAVVVANNILGGGGFSSRLLQNVRTDLGLAYSVYSYFQAPYTHRGRFALGCQTKSETTFKALRAMLSEVERIAGEPVSAEELAVAKESILQSLVFSNAQRSSILERATRYEINNFPQDYLDRFQAGIAKVTVADVQAAAKKHMRPEAMVYVLVGKVESFDEKPDALGLPVEEIDVDKPAWASEETAGEEAAPVDPHALTKGKAIYAEAVEILGGADTLRGVVSRRGKGKGTIGTPNGPLPVQVETVVVYAQKQLKLSLTLPFGLVIQCYDGKAGWVMQPGGVVIDLPPSQAKDLAKQVEQDDMSFLKSLLDAEGPAFNGTRKFGEVEGALVLAHESNLLFLDPQTKAIIGRESVSDTGTMTTYYQDIREVSGLRLPFSVRTVQDGNEAISITFDSLELNPELPEDTFSKPEK
ncbi:MAG: M16 family metallopeptidase, partial [Planctomycetota bacterium]